MQHLRQSQWLTLHQQYEHYEMLALVIKLVAVVLTLVAVMFAAAYWPVLLILAVLWLQEGIWKTFQARLEASLLALETQVTDDDLLPLYTNWQQNRPGLFPLVAQYLRAALRPTVAYPYLVLMFIALLPG
ncbi:hypothetical protein [Lacimicrobium sp. SS2-24]|uniref:hypothetical protein n=1 Tax=Lacimicrobium sp. SS2-24 TaxID=2005569 RepID=UPI000B4BCC96|nr:hypothetical protein [Lacimicrobium sp. SS2-24]